MSTEPKASSSTPSANRQRRQAHTLLLRLQWLLILLLIIALAWLYISQQRFQSQVNKRLQSNEQVVSRLNEMDDRLFAISQQARPSPSIAGNNQAQNQLDLLRIQLQSANRLQAADNYSAAIDLLRSLQWQLSQDSNEIAPALTAIIKQSLSEDIEHLQARSSQPSSWQLQNLAIQNIQEFLHSYEQKTLNKRASNVALSPRQLTIHEVIMTLNLAIQASHLREPDQLSNYLRQARSQLQTLTPASSTSASSAPQKSDRNKDQPITTPAPANIQEVMVWLDNLIANKPATTLLLTTQVLESPKS